VRLMCALILYIMMDQSQLLKYIIITKMRKWESHLVTNIESCLVQNRDGDGESVNSATILVHKLVSVLESIEKLPVYLYDTPGSGYGLQVMQCGKISLCTICWYWYGVITVVFSLCFMRC